MAAWLSLYDHQKKAIEQMRNGCILNGGVGSGKSRASLAYYFKENGGDLYSEKYGPMTEPRDLYIITTAQKRDKLEWEAELVPFLLSTDPELNYYKNKIVVDSWNNIQKYSNVYGAFFIFDEQRLVGSGAWVKAFLKMAKRNKWILLSATPGDTWQDYIPVFVANGFYKSKTEFSNEHIVYNRFVSYPQVERYLNTGRLIKLRNAILIDMDFDRGTTPHHEDVYVRYNVSMYKDVCRTRTDPYNRGYIPCLATDEGALLVGLDISKKDVTPIMKGWDYEPQKGDYVRLANAPIKNASGFCYTLRKIVNSDDSRMVAVMELLEKHPRLIIFYNFDYELELLKYIDYGPGVTVAEWNGHKHEPVPNTDSWVYLVQYTAGAEGWNCIKTDTIVFYSQNYSYKIMKQSAGRIDRLNTPYKDLYYYHLKTRSGIDLAISQSLSKKKKFNESRWVKW